MDKAYNPKEYEDNIYKLWEEGGYFLPVGNNTNYFTIALPPPNANGDLHLGHAVMTIEDIMIRYNRMLGKNTLFIPGSDHAGFETQYVFEKHLAKLDKSRFDYSRDELYKNIMEFVLKNRSIMENQIRKLGFSVDWTRNVFTLDEKVITTVYDTFKKLFDEGLVYRGDKLVNYCTKCGTSFSDLEANHIEQSDKLYYIKYGPFVIATVRPETKFGDTGICVNPKDKRYKKYIGKTIEVTGLTGKFNLTVVADEKVDPKFGTGVIKVTPAHDPTDYEIGLKNNLPLKQIIGFDGKLTSLAGPYQGLKIKIARQKVADDLQTHGLIDHIDENYTHTVTVCYRCGTTLEPLPLKQWFIKLDNLKSRAKKSIVDKEVEFIPKKFEKIAKFHLNKFYDWNISRQIVWGIRIPAWKCVTCTNKGPEKWIVTSGLTPNNCPDCNNNNLIQDTDTFDTWFSSGQWPVATLKGNKDKNDFSNFYPLSVMETGYDILPQWVLRMLMLGIYMTDTVPFKKVYLHGLVRDSKGQKMSKSKGNVISPLEMIDKYSADALRMALVFGTSAGNDQSLSEEKIRGMRNFANKLWNIGRFISMCLTDLPTNEKLPEYTFEFHKNLKNIYDKRIITELNLLIAQVSSNMEKYQFSYAAQKIYKFTWNKLADVHIEKNKERLKNGDIEAIVILRYTYYCILKLLHPFMPFVTEAIWQKYKKDIDKPLILQNWPNKN